MTEEERDRVVAEARAERDRVITQATAQYDDRIAGGDYKPF